MIIDILKGLVKILFNLIAAGVFGIVLYSFLNILFVKFIKKDFLTVGEIIKDSISGLYNSLVKPANFSIIERFAVASCICATPFFTFSGYLNHFSFTKSGITAIALLILATCLCYISGTYNSWSDIDVLFTEGIILCCIITVSLSLTATPIKVCLGVFSIIILGIYTVRMLNNDYFYGHYKLLLIIKLSVALLAVCTTLIPEINILNGYPEILINILFRGIEAFILGITAFFAGIPAIKLIDKLIINLKKEPA